MKQVAMGTQRPNFHPSEKASILICLTHVADALFLLSPLYHSRAISETTDDFPEDKKGTEGQLSSDIRTEDRFPRAFRVNVALPTA